MSLPPEQPGGEPVQVSFTIGTDVRFSLRTRDPALYRKRNAAATEQFEDLFAACRAGPPAPQHLTKKQVSAYAGEVYRLFADRLEDDPILTPNEWRAIARSQAEDLEWNVVPLGIYTSDSERTAARATQRLKALEGRYGRLVDAILAKHGLAIDSPSREALVLEVAKVTIESSTKLARNADGDYTPDRYAERFPAIEAPQPRPSTSGSTLTFDDLRSRWEAEGKKARKTQAALRTVIRAFQQHLGHTDARRVTRADVLSWKDALLAKGLSAKTINDSYLALIRILFRVAKRNDLLREDPTDGISVLNRARAGRKPKVYTDEEVATILALADRETAPHLHWVPWLLALTGARVGEITQLWGKHITSRNDIPFLIITPTDDGGEIKNETSEREVPLHPALIDRGFLKFVATRNGGPLFYGGRNATPRPPKPGAISHAAKGPANRVRGWIREQGFTDPRKAPNHAFRRWFKSACVKVGVNNSVANAIQGHSGNEGEADQYRHFEPETLYRAVCKVQVPSLAPPVLDGQHPQSAGHVFLGDVAPK